MIYTNINVTLLIQHIEHAIERIENGDSDDGVEGLEHIVGELRISESLAATDLQPDSLPDPDPTRLKRG